MFENIPFLKTLRAVIWLNKTLITMFVFMVSVSGNTPLCWLWVSLSDRGWDSCVRREKTVCCYSFGLFFYSQDDEFLTAKRRRTSGKQMKHQFRTRGEQNLLRLSSQQHNTPQRVNNWYDTSTGSGEGKISPPAQSADASISSTSTLTTHFLTRDLLYSTL